MAVKNLKKNVKRVAKKNEIFVQKVLPSAEAT